eukprot:g1253.t1
MVLTICLAIEIIVDIIISAQVVDSKWTKQTIAFHILSLLTLFYACYSQRALQLLRRETFLRKFSTKLQDYMVQVAKKYHRRMSRVMATLIKDHVEGIQEHTVSSPLIEALKLVEKLLDHYNTNVSLTTHLGEIAVLLARVKDKGQIKAFNVDRETEEYLDIMNLAEVEREPSKSEGESERRGSYLLSTMLIDDDRSSTTSTSSTRSVGAQSPEKQRYWENVIDDWNQDSWEVYEKYRTEKWKLPPLSVVCDVLFSRYSMYESLNLEPSFIQTFVKNVEKTYNSTAYHNAMHAYDVLCNSHVLFTDISDKMPTKDLPILRFVLYIAAVGHDANHDGFTNKFHTRMQHELAIRYNDIAVMENHHAATLFRVLLDSKNKAEIPSGCQIFDLLTFEIIRKDIIDLILATDLAGHYDYISRLKRHYGNFKVSTETTQAMERGGSLTPSLIPNSFIAASFNSTGTSKVTPASATIGSSNDLPGPPSFTDHDDIVLHLQACIKFGDIGHPCKSFEIHEKWSNAILKEFHNESDTLIEFGHEPVFFMRRSASKAEQIEGHINFVKFICLPLFETMRVGPYFPKVNDLLQRCHQNTTMWKSKLTVEKAQTESAMVTRLKAGRIVTSKTRTLSDIKAEDVKKVLQNIQQTGNLKPTEENCEPTAKN